MRTIKKLSILGDSISTYKGISNDASANYSTRYNPCFYKDPMPPEATYWGIVMKTFGLELCVNNSWSGGNMSGAKNPDSGVNRAGNLARDDGVKPDIIIIFMGINDLGRGTDPEIFFEDYKKALSTIAASYPDSVVCCVNLPNRDSGSKSRAEIFNSKISDAALFFGEGFFVADLFSSPLNNDCYYDNTVDGIHPDADGMRMIADVVISAIRKNCGAV